MPITRHYLDAAQPALPQGARWLLDQAISGDEADLRGMIVVVPSRRAGRRLEELLVDEAHRRSITLRPPPIITEGQAPEMFYRPLYPFANDLTQRMAWAESLQALPRQRLREAIPHLPEESDAEGWESLAELLRIQHLELTSDGLSFADVVKATGELGELAEQKRWTILREVQEHYLDRLDAEQLWDRQTARLVAIEKKECSTEKDIILIGTVDLNLSFRKMIDSLSARVTALMHAPQQWADRFDAYGSLIPSVWQNQEIEIAAEQIRVVEGPEEQAEAVVQVLAEYEGQYRGDEISIGLADERLVPPVARRLAKESLPHRWGPGRLFVELAPYQLLRAMGAFLASSRFSDLATLARHPEVDSFISRQGMQADWLTLLDDYQSHHLPLHVGQERMGGDPLSKGLQLIRQWLQPLAASARSLADWMPPLAEVLQAIYAEKEGDKFYSQDQEEISFFRKVRDAMDAIGTIPASLSPSIGAPKAIEILLEQIARERIPDKANPEAIEILGWLELALDDAPALIIAGFNEGLVPKSIGADPFLPNTLRSQLGLNDNARRYARDAYALSILLLSRPKGAIIAGRRDGEQNPLLPSRLLFAAPPEVVARRTLAIYDTAAAPLNQSLVNKPSLATEDVFGFDVPRPIALEQPIESLRVTAFRSYMACPYRFYLEHILKLKSSDDHAVELDGAAFGSMLHDALQVFGQAEGVRASTDEEEIATFLECALADYAASNFSDNTTPAVAIQVEQARLRLRAFARCQAEWAREGWRIHHAESDAEAPFLVEGEPITIRGRIDRIDYHPESGRWAILDYKSGDSGIAPEGAHKKKGEWVDLQLPLYRKLVAALGVPDSASLGYILLPRDTQKTGFVFAEWEEEEFAEAEEAAKRVVRGIRAQRFWPPAKEPPPFSESLAWICLDNLFDLPDFAAASSEGECR